MRSQTKAFRRISWTPHPGPQTALFETPADFILYGGAKGGGKSNALLVLCGAIDANKAGYRAIIFRRTFPELERHIIPLSHKLLSGIGQYDAKNHRWKFKVPAKEVNPISLSDEAILEFGFLERESDVNKYSGAEYARIGFDESTQFSENSIRTMLSCLRSPVPNVKRQCILVSNPVGPGYGWHKRIFIDGRIPVKIYSDGTWPSDGRPIGMRTVFIPARVWDNPTLLKNDPDYPKRLQTQSREVAVALLEGSWEQTIYLALDFNPDVHTIDPVRLPPYSQRIIAIDWGKRDKAVAVWLAADDRFIYAYRDLATRGKDIRPFAFDVVDKCRTPDGKMEPIDYVVLSHECFSDRGMGVTQADQFQEVLSQFGMPLTKSDKDPEGRLLLLREYLRTSSIPIKIPGAPDPYDLEYWSRRLKEGSERDREMARLELARLQQGTYDEGELPKLKIFRSSADGRFGCPELIQTLPLLVTEIVNVKVLADGQDDHGYDALTYGLKALVAGGAPAEVSLPVEERHRRLLDGRIVESGMEAELTRRAAESMPEEEFRAIPWRVERFKYGGSDDGGDDE